MAGVLEQDVLVALDDARPGVAQVLGQPSGRDELLGVGVGGELRVGVQRQRVTVVPPAVVVAVQQRPGAVRRPGRDVPAAAILPDRRRGPRTDRSATVDGTVPGCSDARGSRRTAARGYPPQQLVAELVPPPRFADVRFATYVPAPDHPTQAGAVAGHGRLRRSASSPAAAPARPGGPLQAQGRDHRRAGDATSTAGSASARPTCSSSLYHQVVTEGGRTRRLRHLRGVHQPRRCAGLPARRRGAGAERPRLHRRVRAGRPGRHRPDVAADARARRPRRHAGGDVEHAARGAWARGASPRRTSSARSRRSPGSSTCVRVDGEDYRHRGLGPRPRRCPTRTSSAPPPPARARRSTTSPTVLEPPGPASTPAATARWSARPRAVCLRGVSTVHRPDGGAAAGGARRPALRPGHAGASRPACPSTRCSPTS